MEITPQATATIHRHLLRLIFSILTVIVSGFGVVTAVSGAMFTDTETTNMDVSAGWVDVTTGGSNVVALANLKPGDVFFRSVNLANAGSLDFNYSITASRPSGTNAPLVDAILVETYKMNDAANCTAANYQTGTLIAASSTLNNLNVTNQLMVPSSSHAVCFRFTLPISASNSIAGKSTSVTMTIASTQV